MIDTLSLLAASLFCLYRDATIDEIYRVFRNESLDPPRRNLQEHHRRSPHPNYEKPRMQCDQFIVKHFAGRVIYDVAGFLEKNNDSLQVCLV